MKETLPVTFQRVENIVIAMLALIIYARAGFIWYGLPIGFLLIDLSAIGYMINAKVGALSYNIAHSYFLPVGALLLGYASGRLPSWLFFVALVWIFHIATDRVLGYGLKFSDSFTHTHLGMIGRGKR